MGGDFTATGDGTVTNLNNITMLAPIYRSYLPLVLKQ
jgi:hypothetical protein